MKLNRVTQIATEIVYDTQNHEAITLYNNLESGKMLRSKLILSIVENDLAYKLCAIVELIQSASLLHDDVIDESLLRRGRSSINAIFGNKNAIMLGDILYAKAFFELTKFAPEIAQSISHSVSQLSIGELEDVSLEQKFNNDENKYLTMICHKSASLIAASAESAALLANVSNAKSYYDRIKKLHAAGGISDNDADSARTKMESANYQIQIAREKLNYMSHRSGYERIYAPQDGVILSKIASEQQYLNPGSTVVQFQGIDDVEAYIFVSQNYINKIKRGEQAKVRVDAIRDEIFDAIVKEISQTSLEQLTYRVKLKILRQSPKLKDGMSASAVFKIKENADNQILIPINSLVKEGDKNIVYIIVQRQEGIGVIRENAVVTGGLVGDEVIITSGLNIGDWVVTRGVNEVQDGQKVKY